LADEVPAWVSKKRNKNSVDRTVKWLDECVALSPVKIISFFQVKLV
jgi:queuine tRNA-ribosyltransferase subunit QTRTD1